MKPTNWNTYRITPFVSDVANDRASSGCIHCHQVRRSPAGWQKRIMQVNGRHVAYGPVEPLSNAEGSAAFATAQQSNP